ncbi:MAG: DUF760 domain-containing protein [Synechococcus sp.]
MSFPSNPQSESNNLRAPGADNQLWQYLKAQEQQNAQTLAQQVSEDALEILSHHIRGMLGTLPSEQFGVQVVTSRESLAQLLTGAMMSGYYLRTQEQKLQLEHAFGLRSEDGISEANNSQDGIARDS